ncbi:MAG: hypothetical protein V2I33_08510 [Kangiellaceae bacterium]|jgi:hypothetical protein|nr:hypothetical protein [Kangiellaceae bacterium]
MDGNWCELQLAKEKIDYYKQQLTQKDELLEEACRLIGNHHIKGKEESEFLRRVKELWNQ